MLKLYINHSGIFIGSSRVHVSLTSPKALSVHVQGSVRGG
jgi:hypothetical protein